MTDHLATVPTEPKAYHTSRAGTAPEISDAQASPDPRSPHHPPVTPQVPR